MQIEQFDTGLKGTENAKKLIISPQENYDNKLKIRDYLNTIVINGISSLDKNLANAFSENVKINCFYPINEFT